MQSVCSLPAAGPHSCHVSFAAGLKANRRNLPIPWWHPPHFQCSVATRVWWPHIILPIDNVSTTAERSAGRLGPVFGRRCRVPGAGWGCSRRNCLKILWHGAWCPALAPFPALSPHPHSVQNGVQGLPVKLPLPAEPCSALVCLGDPQALGPGWDSPTAALSVVLVGSALV